MAPGLANHAEIADTHLVCGVRFLRLSMLRNYLTIAVRNLRRHFGYTFVNVIGLAVGIACCLLVFLYIRFEYSFDAYHEKGDRAYRLIAYSGFGEKRWISHPSGDPVPAMRDSYTEVEDAAKGRGWGHRTIVHEGEVFPDVRLALAESNLFNIMSLGLLEGDPRSVLQRPQTAVLTESLAKRLFQDRDPIGRYVPIRLKEDEELQFEVTGLMRDVPVNSHLQFDMLASWESLRGTGYCLDCGQYMYALLKPSADPGVVAKRALSMIRDTQGKKYVEDLRLEPLSEIHFSYADGAGDIRYVYLLTAIAALMLLIACVNYVNLATARSIGRAREVGVRKVMGAHPAQIIRQFLMETVVLTALALPFALFLLTLSIPTFNDLARTGVELNLAANVDLLASVVAILILVGLLAGAYPALFLSRFRPTEVLSGRLPLRFSGAALRRVLIVFQFASAIVLIVATAVVLRQLRYMQDKKLGFETEQVITVKVTDPELRRNPGPLTSLFLQQSGVLSATVLANAPGEPGFSGTKFVDRPFGEGGPAVEFAMPPIDENFLWTFQIPLLAGSNISIWKGRESAREALINEAGIRAMRWESPEQALDREISGYRIVGVVPDFNYESLHKRIEPLLLRQNDWEQYGAVALRLSGGEVRSTISAVEEAWMSTDTPMPFEYTFLEDEIAQLYVREQRTAKIFGTFAGLAIFISCLGLLGLAAFAAAQRTKEIGIRKVLGATLGNIVTLLTSEFVKLIGLAILVALPIAHIASSRWLEDFAYRIELEADVFVIAGAVTLFIALAVTGIQALRAASADPVDSLRWE